MSELITNTVKDIAQLRLKIEEKLQELLKHIEPDYDLTFFDPGLLLNQKLQLLITGRVNSGKSSFITELFQGEVILPSAELPCTARWVQLVYSDEPYMQIIDSGIRLTRRDYSKEEKCFIISPVESINEWYYGKDGGWGKFKFSLDKGLEGRILHTYTGIHPTGLHCSPFDQEINLGDDDRKNLAKLSCYVKIGIPNKLLQIGLEIVDSLGLGENDLLDKMFGEIMKTTFPDPFLVIYVCDNRGSLSRKDVSHMQRIKSYRYRSYLPIPAIFVANKIDVDVLGANNDWDKTAKSQQINFDKSKALIKLRQQYQARFPASDLCGLSTRTLKSIRLGKPLTFPEATDLHLNCFKSLEHAIDDKINKFSWLSYKRHIYGLQYYSDTMNIEDTDKGQLLDKCLHHISEIEQLLIAPRYISFLHNFDFQVRESMVWPVIQLDNRSSIYDAEIETINVEIAVHQLADISTTKRDIFIKYLCTMFNSDLDNYLIQPIAKYYNSSTQTFYLMFPKPERRLFDQLPGLDLDYTEKYIQDLWLVLRNVTEQDPTFFSFVIDPNDRVKIDLCRFALTPLLVVLDKRVNMIQNLDEMLQRIEQGGFNIRHFGLCVWLLLEGSGTKTQPFTIDPDLRVSDDPFSESPDLRTFNKNLLSDSERFAYHRPATEWPNYLKKVLHSIWTKMFLTKSHLDKQMEIRQSLYSEI